MNNFTLEIEQVNARQYNWKKQSDMDSPHGRPRVYISWPNYSVMENLENRYNRPYKLIQKQLEELLRSTGLKFEKMRWSQKAGCTMCGCSPGFILEGASVIGMDMWVNMEVAE